jgi:hypothetical protein
VIAYQGQSFPALRGSILFADFLGKVFVGYQLDDVWEYQTWFELAELDLAGTFILSLALDPAGEPLLLTSSSGIRSDNQGSVLRITP